jgi:O-methyltransferase involved in polyketide biosynthesis
MYLTREAVVSVLDEAASFAPGSTLILSFSCRCTSWTRTFGSAWNELRPARANGTPFSRFSSRRTYVPWPRTAGFREARHVSGADSRARYFANRADGLPPNQAEEFLVATV